MVQAETGGGFGGKEEYPSMLAVHASLLARAAGRPVRMVYDRHEDIIATTKRHPAVVRHRTGVTGDGRLVAQDIEVILDAGAYATLSPVVLSRGALHATGPYRCPNVRVRARAMMTNTVPAGAFRGFGAPQTEFAAEVHLSRIAEALGIPAAELRRRIAYRTGDVTATGQVLKHSVAAIDVLERAEEASGFEAERSRTGRRAAADDRVASGVGLALGWHGAGFTGSGEKTLASVAGIELRADGRIRILTAQTEIGQGASTVLPQIAADVLGVPVDAVEPAPLDTALVPNSGPTVASRTTMVVGGLVADAAAKLRARVEERTGRPFAESWRDDAAAHGSTRIDVRFDGFPGIEWDPERYRGDAYPAYSWAAAVAFVDVDRDTGQVAVRRVVAVDEAGRIVNPVLAAGQVEGGTLQAVGYATIEEMRVVDGRYRNDRLATYLIPTALDAPAIEAHLLESPFPDSPHGAKGLGELPMDVGAPAVIDAIHDATGAWITELPATPARVLAALRALEDERLAAPVPGWRVVTAPVTAPAVRASSSVRFTVNGQPVEVAAPGGRRLLDVLRLDLGLTGAKEGCGEGECGACSVLIDGEVVDSCLVPVCQVEGRAVRTVEGLATDGRLDPLQAAFVETGGVQCGICTPGMLMAGRAFLDSAVPGAAPTDAAIREAISGNLCRCTGYGRIVEAIRLAAGRPAATDADLQATGRPPLARHRRRCSTWATRSPSRPARSRRHTPC